MQKFLDGIPVGQHVYDLMNRNPRTFYTRLAMAYPWIDCDSLVHARILQIACLCRRMFDLLIDIIPKSVDKLHAVR